MPDDATRQLKIRQADVAPIQVDGVQPFLVGTAISLIAVALFWIADDRFEPRVLQAGIAAVVIGVAGLCYVYWRKWDRKKMAARGETPDTP